MIIVTGGAGFIGSALIWKLNQRGISDILVIDRLGTSEKWKNLVNLQFNDYLDKESFITKLESDNFGNSIDTIFHLGACSSTTEKDADYLIENNFHYSVRLAQRCLKMNTRFIYASSAATYGSGENGYNDDENLIKSLKPLNMYGYSKQLFDLYALRMGWLKRIVGLKYFNVFGPNEYHKGDMRSLVCKSYPKVQDFGKIDLFKSHNRNYRDGEQLRDFIYVKDAVEMTLHFYDNKDIGGIFNIGTSKEHSWNDLAYAMFKACEKEPNIEYIEMPEQLKPKYQYFTRADITKLRETGYKHKCWPLNEAIKDYVTNYLQAERYIGE